MSAKSAATTLILTRRLGAPPASVYAAWTDPAKMRRWFGPEGAEVLQVQADVRVGGGYRVRIRTPDGVEHEASGVYREVVPSRKLVFTWTWTSTPERETLVTVPIEGQGGGTRLTLKHERLFDELDRDNHEAGWRQSLDRLEAHLVSR